MGTSASVLNEKERLKTVSVSRISDRLSQNNYNDAMKPMEILVTKTGFSKQKLSISIGQAVIFLWDNEFDTEENELHNSVSKQENKCPISIVQVIEDDAEGRYKSVIGGFNSGKPLSKGSFAINFKLNGEYRFKIKNHPKDLPICLITVTEEQPICAQISDDGFQPKFIKIEEGRSIKWDWSYCTQPHSIYETEYCDTHSGLFRISKELVVSACSNTYKRVFPESGIFFFQTESRVKEKKHVCVVEVVESFRDYKIEIFDSRYSPMLLSIEEGDRVWFSWNKDKCLKKHAIYEVILPMPDHKSDEPYFEKKNGFKWNTPTRNGLLCHRFDSCGVYYYSDIIEDECASYIGIIIVKPKPANYDVIINKNSIEPDIRPIEAGDRVWWRWNPKQNVSINFLNANLLYDKKIDSNKCFQFGDCEEIDAASFSRFGVFSIKLTKPGVYYYKIQIDDHSVVSTVVASAPPKDHKIEISDNGFTPSIINVNPEDRIWFIWTETKRSHNIRQVTHQNQFIKNGFLSGALMEPPGAFMYSFSEQGIFYFHSDGLKNCLGAVVVVPEPTIQVIHVNEEGIVPDPLVASVYDTVLWVFPTIQTNDIVEITNQNDLLTYPVKSDEIIGRRCISRSFKESNVYHFASPSFNRVLKKEEMDSKGYKNIVLSSVIVDKKFEYVLVAVDKDGFHPDYLNIPKNKSILFDWKDSNESHNIIHIKKPFNEHKIELIEGSKAFSSKNRVVNDNFLYTFEEEGEYYIASEGAPGQICLINVLPNVLVTATPRFVNKESSIINKYHKIHLHCDTPGATIYYTTNGMQPNRNSSSLKLYDTENGILLTEIGFCFIRSVAISEGCVMSDIMTSQRFFVVDNFGNREDLYAIPESEHSLSNIDWWRAIPKITVNYIGEGCIEIIWDKPLESSFNLMSHYQLFLNRVSYKQRIKQDTNRVIARGLSGGRSYEISLMVFPKSQSYLPQQSNIVTFRCPKMTENGGPLISLKANPKNNQITLVWQSIDTEAYPIDFYQLIVNNEKKEIIRSSNTYNKVIVDGFESGYPYSIMVVAVPKNSLIPLMSNEINFKLPLGLDQINLPDPALRDKNKDFYDEYISVEDYGFKQIPKSMTFVKHQYKKSNQLQKFNYENKMLFDMNTLQDHLPVPKVSASYLKPGVIVIEWVLTKLPQPPIELGSFIVNLVGTEFGNITKSDSSYDCFMELNGVKLPAVQYCWTVTNYNNSITVDGILDTSIYQIFVAAVYTYEDKNNQMTEFKKSSPIINYSSLGPPHAPKLKVINIDLQSVTLEWSIYDYPKPDFISGYRLLVNSEYKEKFSTNQHEFIFNELKPGKAYKLELIALTNSIIGQSEPSKPITVICPKKPKAPLIYQSSTLKINSIVVSWKPTAPRSINKEDQIWMYRIYLNNQFHGEIFSSNLSSYSYMISDLISGLFYDVTVRALCGQRIQLPSEDDTVYTLVSSDISNVVSATPTAPPLSPPLKLESLHPDGIDVTWLAPQQYGEASISGYQLIVNGNPLNMILPADATRTTIKNINLGGTVNLQIMALTNHPCGQYSTNQEHPNYNTDYALLNGNSNNDLEILSVIKNTKYTACKPGPSLVVKYSNLVLPALNIKFEKITGHSSIITWETNVNHIMHYIKPEYYSISYWEKNSSIGFVKNITTKNEYIQLNDLKPSTLYSVIVEARKESKRTAELNKGEENEQFDYTYLVYTRSEAMHFETISPPAAPSNLSLITSNCHGLRISWDLPIDNGSELIATRVECYPVNANNPKHLIKDFTPDTTNCIIENLMEKTKYKVIVTAITEEYFAQHNIKEIKQLPKQIEPVLWLPSSYMDVFTSGTEPATNIQLKISHENIPNISWKSAKVFGTNLLVSQILCYSEFKSNDSIANQIILPPNATNCQINNMKIGSKYKIWIEAAVSIKLTLDVEKEPFIHYNELKDRRITHVISEAIIARIPAPCETPVIFLTGYSTSTIDLYWPKPSMYSEHANPDDKTDSYILYRHLMGYRIEVNGIIQKELNIKENFCTLTNCKPSNIYNVVLIARTCLLDNPKYLNEKDAIETDESKSITLQVKLPSDIDNKVLKSIRAKFEELKDESGIGKIHLNWFIQDIENISQFNINWFIPDEAISQRKSMDANSNNCSILVKKLKCIYEIVLEVVYKNLKSFTSEKLSIEIPGSPNAPKLWMKEKQGHMFILNWSEPKTYVHVPCSGYQLYINETKAGNKIDCDTLQAAIPLKPNRSYKIAIQALSSRIEYGDSKLSNVLDINTYLANDNEMRNDEIQIVNAQNTFKKERKYLENLDKAFISIRDFYNQENLKEEMQESSLPLKISKVGEDYIDLDWSNFVTDKKLDPDGFKVQLHCWNTNKHEEEIVKANDTQFTVKNCSPGHIYSIRVIAIQYATKFIINKSKYAIVQTCASPDTPVLKLRACNSKYITIEWNIPKSYGDAILVGYKIYIDGKATAVVSSEQTAFTLSNGIPCHEYDFQIQAMTERENLFSTISESLSVIWPGVKPPNLQLIEYKNRNIKVGWQEPRITGNAKISFYRITCQCEQNDRLIIQGPLDPSITECNLNNLDYGRHQIQLEINLYGATEPFVSTPLYVDLGSKPEKPLLIALIPALEERVRLDFTACKLINKRDRILKMITNNGLSKQNRDITKSQLEKSMFTLGQLEEALDDCLNFINLFTGFFVVNLSWQGLQQNHLSRVAGYKVYLNGKQYGTDLPESITNIRIKLSLEQVSHKIMITAFCSKPFLESEPSNVIEIPTERFLQFSFFCYNNTHFKNSIWPKYGCCAFQDSIAFERLNLAKNRENVNLGLLSTPQPFPICRLFDLLTGKPTTIIEQNKNKTKQNKINIILFWAKWCLPSMRMLRFMVNFARKNSEQYEFIACHHGNESVEEMRDLLKRTGFIDSNIHFYSDSSEILKIHNIDQLSITDIYDIKGLPLIFVLDKNACLAWRGRYCCYEYEQFEYFIHHTLCEVMDIKCIIGNCEICINDINIDQDLNDLRSQQKNLLQYKDIIKRPSGNKQKYINNVRNNAKQTKQLIDLSIQERPFSASRNGSERFSFNESKGFTSKLNEYQSSSDDLNGFCYYKINNETS